MKFSISDPKTKYLQTPWRKIVTTEQTSKRNEVYFTKLKLRTLLLNIMQKSTAIPFRRRGNKFLCFYCESTFYNASELKKHSERDVLEMDKNVNLQSLIVRHTPGLSSVKIDITNLSCKLCSKTIGNIENFLDHLDNEHNEKLSKEALKCILEFKLTDDKVTCLICGDQFQYFGPLLLHTYRTHTCRQFICEICGLSFASKGSVFRHTQGAHPTANFPCRHCDKKFYAVHRRDDHERRTHDVNHLKCNVCSEILGSEYKRDTHLALVHNVWINEFKCTKCPKAFRYKNHLVIHDKRVHLKEKNKTCQVCGDKFFNNYLLKLHMVRHSDARPFQCDTCNKTFPRKRALETHTRIHTNDRRCVCKLCGKAFIQTASLKQHLKVHHKDSTLTS